MDRTKNIKMISIIIELNNGDKEIFEFIRPEKKEQILNVLKYEKTM